MKQTIVSVERGQLCIRTDFLLKDRCKAINGFTWLGERKQWAYPPTPANAQAIHAAFPDATWATEALALRDPLATPLPPAPVSMVSKTPPWPHQRDAFDFITQQRFGPQGGGALMAMEMGPQPTDANILTPYGWIRMGDLSIGDLVIGRNGHPTTVTNITKRGYQPIYSVVMSEGSTTECTDNHLWEVNTPLRKNRGYPPMVLPLSEIRAKLHDAAGNRRWFIPMVEPVKFPKIDHPVMSPYLLGVLLGDGGMTTGSLGFTKHDPIMREIVWRELPEGITPVHKSEGTYILSGKKSKRNILISTLRTLGLFGKRCQYKFIPDAYLWSSIDDRLALLQGLCDTDGYVEPGRNTVEYCSTSKQLADGVTFLVRSLGGRSTTTLVYPKRGLPAYRVHFGLPTPFIPFRLPRKANAYAPRTKYEPTRGIESVKPIGIKEVQCIQVENPDGLYVTDDFIVTHNTGKTLPAIALIPSFGFERILVSCPKSVVPVWQEQVEKHSAVNMHVCVLDRGSVDKRTKQAEQALSLAKVRHQPCMIVINHESLRLQPFYAFAMHQPWDFYIADEIHRLKAAQGKQSLAIALLVRRIPYRLGLTGTPLPHGPMDAFGIFRILDPSLFGTSFVAYRNHYAVMKEISVKAQGQKLVYDPHAAPRSRRTVSVIDGYKNIPELQAKMATATFRVLAKDVLDLPPTQHLYRLCELDEGAETYQALAEEFSVDVAAGKITPKNALVRLVRLQQVTSGFVVTDDGTQTPIDNSKLKLLKDILDDLELREPIVIFGLYHHDLDAIRRICEDTGRTVSELSGRKNELKNWQAQDSDILVTQMQSGGVGIDLTRAHFTIFYSLGFDLGLYEQALKRTDRPGQCYPVRYIHLLAQETIDMRVYGALRNRKHVVDTIMAHAHEGARQADLVAT